MASEVLDSQANDSWESDAAEESKIIDSNNDRRNRSGQSSCNNSFGSLPNDSQNRDSSMTNKRKGYINLNIFNIEEGVNPIVLPVLKVKPLAITNRTDINLNNFVQRDRRR